MDKCAELGVTGGFIGAAEQSLAKVIGLEDACELQQLPEGITKMQHVNQMVTEAKKAEALLIQVNKAAASSSGSARRQLEIGWGV